MTNSPAKLADSAVRLFNSGKFKYWKKEDFADENLIQAAFNGLGERNFREGFSSLSYSTKIAARNIVRAGSEEGQRAFEIVLELTEGLSKSKVAELNGAWISTNRLLASPGFAAMELTPEHSIEVEGQAASGTLNNWIANYRQFGATPHHQSFERFKYLHESKQVQGLSVEDKSILDVILKAHDERSQLFIDMAYPELLREQIRYSGEYKDISVQETPERTPETQVGSVKQKPPVEIPKLEVHNPDQEEGTAPVQTQAPINLSGKPKPQQVSNPRTSENHVVDLKNMK